MDINELINWGRTIEHGLRFVPPPDGVIRLYRQYRPDNLDEYYRWKEYSIRFLNLYSPADQERFVDYSNKFEQHFLSRYISNMIGILEACESMPSEKLVKLKEEAERNSDVDKVEKLEQMYLSQTTEDKIHLSSTAFHQWHAAACVLFDKWFYPSEDDWIKFQSIDGNGNGYSLHGTFEQIYSPYKKLMARLKDGRNLRSVVHKQNMPSADKIPQKKINIFISYSHSDEKWLERLKKHLKVLAKISNSIEYW